ncbi:ROK family protein [Bifidobacterium sp. ESL0745]|uniref:ROK family protein n=1 Tax=Bifidobacterium sp. ESL0745 TaxID=2983226 RepID=UPI0023F78E1C|nr:ROK family protein [Bifidobacterium sp. ESL0745]MDF7664710.1 ROK family protein [Bifidobacterium sp. ESL0745]
MKTIEEKSGLGSEMNPVQTGNRTGSHQRAERNGLYIGIDIGGTKIAGSLMRFRADGSYRVLDSQRIKVRRGGRQVVEDVTSVVLSLLDRNCVDGSGVGDDVDKTGERHMSVNGVGLCIPGRVDPEAGVVENVANLDIGRLALADEIHRTTGLPAHLENDVNAATLGSYIVLSQHRDPRLPKPQVGADVAVFLNLGTGVAAGVLRNGVLDSGFSGVAGEIGHIPVECQRWHCGCGQDGCIETAAGGNAIRRQWPYADPPMPDIIAKAHDVSSSEHDKACETLDTVIGAIADAIDILALAIDPRIIMIGGGTTKTGKPLLDEIRAGLKKRAASSAFIASLHLDERIAFVDPAEPIGCIGSACAMAKTAGLQ